MPRSRILLVDDQPLILLALERMLRRMRNVWEVVVADSGTKAKACLEAESFDVLVADLNMPGYGGVELMDWVREHRPATVRMVLSGHHDKGMIQGSTRSVHRFLTKPCEADFLVNNLVQVLELQALPMGDPDLRGAVGGMGQLPASPITCHKVKAFLNDPGAPLQVLQDLVDLDPGLAAKVLHLADSAFFGSPRSLVNPRDAVAFLGREKLAGLVSEPAAPEQETRLKPIRQDHLTLGRRAQGITRAEGAPASEQDLAFTAGLLAASGPMILALAFPGMSLQGGQGTAPAVDGPALSRQYLNLMGLPGPLLDIVGSYREPSRARDGASLALAAVHVASGSLDEDFLGRAGWLKRVPAWTAAG